MTATSPVAVTGPATIGLPDSAEEGDPVELDLDADPVSLTRALCDVWSVSGHEDVLADAVERSLRALGHLEVTRNGNAVVARTTLGRAERVVLAGHLDTVPVAGNLPSWVEGAGAAAVVYGRGTCDMKSGVAVQLRIAATVPEPSRDITFVFYDQEEVDAARNGLGRISREQPELLDADFAVLLEPSCARVEGGCNGTMRVDVVVRGVAAHSARSWMGRNAIHEASHVLGRLAAYIPREVAVDGLVYREGLNAVGIRGGIAGNVVPDECVVTVNYRFAPDRGISEAEQHLRDLFEGYEVVVTDAAPGARPGLEHPAAAAFVEAVGRPAAPKYGWTDVARFSAMGVPAVNYGPGDPSLAHADDERCPAEAIEECERTLRAWLS